MNPLDELTSHLTGGARVIVIAERDIDLRSQSENKLVLLKISEGSVASGGRGGGFGERRVVGVYVFHSVDGTWTKTFETEDESRAAGFEVPYYVSRLPITMADGTEMMGYGVIEPELVAKMMADAMPSSP